MQDLYHQQQETLVHGPSRTPKSCKPPPDIQLEEPSKLYAWPSERGPSAATQDLVLAGSITGSALHCAFH